MTPRMNPKTSPGVSKIEKTSAFLIKIDLLPDKGMEAEGLRKEK